MLEVILSHSKPRQWVLLLVNRLCSINSQWFHMLECPRVPLWSWLCHQRSSFKTELKCLRAAPTVSSKDSLMIVSLVHGTNQQVLLKLPTVSNISILMASHQNSSGKSAFSKILVQWLQRVCSTLPCMILIESRSMSITTHGVPTSQWAKSDSRRVLLFREQVVKMVWWTTIPSSWNQTTISRMATSLNSLFHLLLDSQIVQNAGVFLIGWVAIWHAKRVVTVRLFM